MAYNTAKSAMIAAAERIVAERGLVALTLTSVRVEAGQANKSAATYHFGSRDGLLAAVVDHRMTPADERRHALLAGLDADGPGRTDTRRLVEAFVLPLAEQTLYRPDSHYARFLAQAVHDPVLAEHIETHLRADSYRRIRDLLAEASPVAREVARWRVQHVIGLVVTAMGRWEGRTRTPDLTDAIVADTIDTCVAIVDAPSTARTPAGSAPESSSAESTSAPRTPVRDASRRHAPTEYTRTHRETHL